MLRHLEQIEQEHTDFGDNRKVSEIIGRCVRGYKNFKTIKKIHIFKKYANENPQNTPFITRDFPALIREGGRKVGSSRGATVVE